MNKKQQFMNKKAMAEGVLWVVISLIIGATFLTIFLVLQGGIGPMMHTVLGTGPCEKDESCVESANECENLAEFNLVERIMVEKFEKRCTDQNPGCPEQENIWGSRTCSCCKKA